MPIITPYYIFDKKKFISILREYQQLGDVYYPIKANDDDSIVDEAIKQSCCFEVDSIEHITMLKGKKVASKRILYSYPIREKKDIKKAYKLGIKMFVVDSVEEYDRVVNIVNNALFFVRLNIIDMLNLKLPPENNKWGLSVDEAKKLINHIRDNKKNVIGISFYLFSEVVKEENNALEKLLDSIFKEFSGYNLRYLNIGGGISYSAAKNLKNNLERTKTSIGAEKIIIEPGTHLLNHCIDMVVSITAIKNVNNKKMIFINSGIYYGLIDVIIKRKNFVIEHFDKEKNKSLSQANENEKYLVCGSSSDVSDFLGEHDLHKDIDVGDQLIIKECGAYSSVMQTGFYKKSKIKITIKKDTI
jgi:ornithine decarboxylase